MGERLEFGVGSWERLPKTKAQNPGGDGCEKKAGCWGCWSYIHVLKIVFRRTKEWTLDPPIIHLYCIKVGPTFTARGGGPHPQKSTMNKEYYPKILRSLLRSMFSHETTYETTFRHLLSFVMYNYIYIYQCILKSG